MDNLFCAIKLPIPDSHRIERLPWRLTQRRSTTPCPRFRPFSDTVPGHLGHPSDPLGHHSNVAQKLSDFRPEPCPNPIGTLSDLPRNTQKSAAFLSFLTESQVIW